MILNKVRRELCQPYGFGCPPFFHGAITPLCIAATGFLNSTVLLVNPAFSQPITPAADGVGTVVTPEGNRFDITGGSISGDGQNLFHSFEELGLSTDQVANFLATPEIQTILGRVTGGNTSTIDGLLQISNSNANLFLINPAGILFGPNAQLDLPAAFTATTATSIGFDGNWFNVFGNNHHESLTGAPDALAFEGNQPGAILNLGDLALEANQSLMLAGGTVINLGTLSTPGGEVTIAAVPGENVVRLNYGNGLLSLDLQLADGTNAPATQLPAGFLPASIPELLTEGTLANATGAEVAADGTVWLTAADTVVPTDPGVAIASGELDVSGEVGGAVAVLGDRVGLVNGRVDASGVNGGGTVRIGGDYQGQGTVPNATVTYVGADVAIEASALVTGDGGRAIVWADDTTTFAGEIIAQGGATFGNGGFVEVSGEAGLTFEGAVDTTAVNGATGTLLLDPTNIEIVATGGTATSITDVNNALNPDLGPGDSTTINAALINAANTNVTLAATNDITVSAPIDFADSNLTILANNDLTVNSDITVTRGDINLFADNDGDGAGNFSLGTVGTLSVNESGDITLIGNVTTIDGTIETDNELINNERSTVRVVGNEIDVRQGTFRSISGTSLVRFDKLDPQQDFVVGTDEAAAGDNVSFINLNAFEGASPFEVRVGFLPGEGTNGDVRFGSGEDLQLDARFRTLELFGNTLTVNSSVDLVDSRLLLFAGEIDFQDGINIFSTGTQDAIFLEPAGRGQDIKIGGDVDSGDDVLDITRSDLAAIDVDSIPDLSVGRRLRIQNGTGTVTIPAGETPFVWEGNLSVWSNDAASTLPIPGTLRIEGDAELGSISSLTGNLEIGADVEINNANGLFYTGANPIMVFNDASLDSAESFTLSDEFLVTNDALFRVSSASDLTIERNITTTQGDVELIADSNGDGLGNLILNDANVTTNGGNFSGIGADIQLNGTAQINTDSGDITFQPSDPTSSIGIGDSTSGNFNLNTTELTNNLQSSGTLTIGSPGFTGTGNISLRNLSSLAGEDYNLTVRGGNIQFENAGPPDFTILELSDNKTAQFISTGEILDGNLVDVRIGGDSGAILFDAANGVGIGGTGMEVSASRVAARTRDSGDILLRLVDGDAFSINSVGGVNGITAAEDGDVSVSFFGDLGGEGATISVDQPIMANGSGAIELGRLDTNLPDFEPPVINLNNLVASENGAVKFESSVSLNLANSEVITTTGDITFNDTVTGDQRLFLETDGGAIQFDEPISVEGLSINARIAELTSPLWAEGTSIDVTASESITTGNIETQSTTNTGGNISLTSAGSLATGNLNSSGPLGGGDITLAAGTSITTDRINSSSASGSGGTIVLEARSIAGSDIETTSGAGPSGNVEIRGFGDNATVSDVTFTTTSNEVSQSGNISVTSEGNLTFNDVQLQSTFGGSGSGGDLTFDSPGDITLINSQISLSTNGSGEGGDIAFNPTSRSLTIDNTEVLTSTTGPGDGGDIRITTGQLNVVNNASIETSTTGSGDGGDIRIETDQLNLANGGRIDAFTAGSGRSGDLIIVNDSPLTLQGEGLTIRALGNGSGAAGDISVTAPVLILDGVELSAASQSFAGGGNINLDVSEVVIMRRGSFINAEATNPNNGKGGNIFINTRILFAVLDENNDIVANAVGGNGGLVVIEGVELFNLIERSGSTSQLRANQTNDLSASSELALDGAVIIDALDGELEALPSDLVDLANAIARGCSAEDPSVANTPPGDFIMTGRGGRSPEPTDIAGDDSPLEDLGPDIAQPEPSVPSTDSLLPSNPQPTRFADAERVIVTKSGDIFLVGDGAWQLSLSCASLRQP